MQVVVRFFARARDLAGADQRSLELPAGAQVSQLRDALFEQLPALKPLSRGLLIAVNNDYASDDKPLLTTDEIACFPPVSGG